MTQKTFLSEKLPFPYTYLSYEFHVYRFGGRWSTEFSNDFPIPIEIMLKNFTFLNLSEKPLSFFQKFFAWWGFS